jgi:hypothetical protein
VKIVGGSGLLGLLLFMGAASIAAAGCHGTSLVPSNGRCGANPLLLVGASAYPGISDAAGVQVGVSAMAIDGKDLYFVLDAEAAPGFPVTGAAGGGAVVRVSTYGGTPTEIAGGASFAGPAFTPTSVILGVTGAAGASADELDIVSVPRDGSAPAILGAATIGPLFIPPATDGTLVYFTDGKGVESVPLTPAASPAVPTGLTPEYPSSLGVFGQHLLMLMPDGNVESLPIGADGGAATTIGAGSAAIPGTLVSCGASACWLATGEIDQIDPAAGPLATVAALTGPVADPSAMVFDGTNFFVSGRNNPASVSSAIASVPGQGGAQVVVATLPSSTSIAVDDACVYFSTSTGIFSLLKNAQGAVVP